VITTPGAGGDQVGMGLHDAHDPKADRSQTGKT
jgi:hypothetical protein